ncbi:MAG: PAS domain S-box protein [Mangrovibacterium sp.]
MGLHILDMNDHAKSNFGHYAALLIGECLDNGYWHFYDDEMQDLRWSHILLWIRQGGITSINQNVFVQNQKLGFGRWIKLRLVHVVGESRNKQLQVVWEDIHEQKKNEIRIKQRLELEQTVTNISTRFVHLEDGDQEQAINEALRTIGELTQVDRTYVFLYHQENNKEMSCTHEWCAPGISEEIDNLKDLPVSIFPWWIRQMDQDEVIYLYSLDDLPAEAISEREILEAQSILSLLVVPIIVSGETVGFMGFDSVQKQKKWTDSDIRLLRMVAEIFGNSFKNIQSTKALVASEEKYRSLIESTSAVVMVVDTDGTFQYVNAVAADNMSDKSMTVIGKKITDFFPKKDAGRFLNNIQQVVKTGQQYIEESVFNFTGTPYWYRTKVQPIFQNGKKLDRVLIYAEDIDQEKKQTLELERLNKRLHSLHRIDRLLLEHLDSGKNISDVALRELHELVPSNIVAYVVFDDDKSRADILSSISEGITFSVDELPLSFSDFDLTKLSKPVVRNHLTEKKADNRYFRFIYELGIRSSLVIPVKVNGELKGVLLLLSSIPGFFNSGYVSTSEDIARQLEIAFKQIYMNEQIQEYNQNLEKLVESRTRERNELSVLNEAIVETTGVAIISTSPDGIIQSFNQTAEVLLGYRSEEVVGQMPVSELHLSHEIDQKRKELVTGYEGDSLSELEVLVRYAEERYPKPLEYTYVDRRKKKIPVLLSISKITDREGQILRYVGVATDISQLKLAEQALELQVSAFENFAYSLVITDVDGMVIWANKSYEKMSGFSFTELVGQKIGKMQRSGVHDPEFYRQMWATILAGKVWRGELYNRRKDGSLYPEDLTITPIRNSSGEIINFVAIKIDITERKREEAKKLENERIQLALLNNVPDLLFRLDTSGTFLDVFTNEVKSLYVSKEDFLKKTVFETMPEALARKSMTAIEQAVSTKQVVTYEYSLPVLGKPSFFENRIVAISDREVLSIIRDITARKEAEEQLQTTTLHLNALIDNMQVGTLFEDVNRQVASVNQFFCQLFGIPAAPSELVGSNCIIAAKEASRLMVNAEHFLSRIDETMAAGEIVVNDELALLDGRYFERDFVPIRLRDQLIGYLWQYRDITARKLNERYGILQRDLGFQLAMTLTLDDALSIVLDSILEIESIDSVGIYLIDRETGNLALRASKGLSNDFAGELAEFSADHPNYQIVMAGQPVYGFYTDFDPDTDLYQQEGLLQLGIIPILYNNQVIGSLNIGSRCRDELRLGAQLTLETIVAQIGSTLSRMRIQQALHQSQKNFQQMFDTLDDFMFIFDMQGRIIKTNPVVEHRLGYSAQELLGTSVLALHPPDRREEAAQIVSEMLEGRVDICPVPLYTKTGEHIPVETKVVLGKWNEQDAMYGISRDISERIKAQEKLRYSEARWQFALESSGDGIWDWDAVTDEVFFSSQWKRMLGYQKEDIIGRLEEWKNRVHPDDLEQVYADLERHFTGETVIYQNEHRMLCKDGSYKWILDRGKVISRDQAGKPLRIIGTHTDISARKDYELSLAESLEKEKELNELKSRFVSMTSHEFRTPLATILVSAETLEAYWDHMSREDIGKKISRIKGNVEFLRQVMEKVLNLSQIERGTMKFDPVWVDLKELLLNIVADFSNMPGQNHQIHCHVPVDNLKLFADVQMIRQVFNNLIGNSLKYSSAGSSIQVVAKETSDCVIVHVEDQGIGISGEDADRILIPFSRGSNVGNVHGTGLGLSLANQFVQHHGGKITFRSQPFVKTVFTVTLPKTQRE